MKMVISEEMSEAGLVFAVGAGYKRCLVAVPIVTLHMSPLAGKTNIIDI